MRRAAKLYLSRPEPSEAVVLDAVLRYCALDKRLAFAQRMNSGAYVTPEGRFIRYGFKGCPDVLAMTAPDRSGRTKHLGGTFVAIEVKRPSGRTTEAQQAFLELVKANGGIAVVAKSVDDVKRAVDEAFMRPSVR